jgi:hypothetical protein
MKITPEQQAEIRYIRDRLVVSKVVATRAVKTKNGDFFVGLSAAWDSTQEDAGGMGSDLIDALGDDEQELAVSQRGMTLKQAKIAGLLLGMQVDIQAVTHALCGGAISEEVFNTAIRAIKRNYMLKTVEAVHKNGSPSGDEGEEG